MVSSVPSHPKIMDKETPMRKYTKSKSSVPSMSWTRLVKRKNSCRNFRIVLFDIAYKPEWRKHMVAGGETELAAKSKAELLASGAGKQVHSETTETKAVSFLSPPTDTTDQSTKIGDALEGSFCGSKNKSYQFGFRSTEPKMSNEYHTEERDEFYGFESSDDAPSDLKANEPHFANVKSNEDFRFSSEDDGDEFLGFEFEKSFVSTAPRDPPRIDTGTARPRSQTTKSSDNGRFSPENDERPRYFESLSTSVFRNEDTERTFCESKGVTHNSISTTVNGQTNETSTAKGCPSDYASEEIAELGDSMIRGTKTPSPKRFQMACANLDRSMVEEKIDELDAFKNIEIVNLGLSDLSADILHSAHQVEDFENIHNHDSSEGLKDVDSDKTVPLNTKYSETESEKIKRYFTERSDHCESMTGIFPNVSTKPSVQYLSRSSICVRKDIENILVDDNDIFRDPDSISDIRIPEFTTRVGRAVDSSRGKTSSESESFDERISRFEITRVASKKKAYFSLSKKANDCEDTIVDIVKKDNEHKEKRILAHEASPDKLEDIILNIIRNLDPYSLDTAINSNEHVKTDILSKKSPRKRRSLKEDIGSEVCVTKCGSILPVQRDNVGSKNITSTSVLNGDENSEVAITPEDTQIATEKEPFKFCHALVNDKGCGQLSEEKGSIILETVSERVPDYYEAYIPANHELKIGQEFTASKTTRRGPHENSESSISEERLRRFRNRTTEPLGSSESNFNHIHEMKRQDQNDDCGLDNNLDKYLNQKVLQILIDHAYTTFNNLFDSSSSENSAISAKRIPENSSDTDAVSEPLVCKASKSCERRTRIRARSKRTNRNSRGNRKKRRNTGAYKRKNSSIGKKASGLGNIEPTICWKCGNVSKCERMFGMHFTSLHLDSSALQCLYCPDEFEHAESEAFEKHYVKHLRQIENDKLKKALENNFSCGGEGVYIKVLSKNRTALYSCLKCNHRTTSCRAIEEHWQEVHRVTSYRKRCVLCNLCTMQFSSGLAKRHHCLNEHRDEMICCGYCYWLYMTKASYYMHLRICPVRRIEDSEELHCQLDSSCDECAGKERNDLSEFQKQYEIDLWWTQTDVTSGSWTFEHNGEKSMYRKIIAKQRVNEVVSSPVSYQIT